MQLNTHLQNLLRRSGLSEDETALYLFILNNPGTCVSDAYKNCGLSKSTAYRAFESLKNLELIEKADKNWKTELKVKSLELLIRRLENKNRNEKRLINELKTLNNIRNLSGDSSVPAIETFKEEKVLEKYLELSQMPWQTDLVFGNWEDFNQPYEGVFDFVKTEKQFIKNRMKNGGNSHIFITKDGPYTHQITDYDALENRTTKVVESSYYRPLWINAFEGNNLVYIWNLDERNKIYSTLIDSKPVADFYKNFMYSFMVGRT